MLLHIIISNNIYQFMKRSRTNVMNRASYLDYIKEYWEEHPEELEKFFTHTTKLLRKNKIRHVDIVKKGLVETVKYKGKNSNPNVAFIKPLSDKPIIYKYDPKDYNGLPLVINTCGRLLAVYDPSPNYNYEITEDINGYNISTYEYDNNDVLFSTTRNSPVMIWNTKSNTMFKSNVTHQSSYNKDDECRGSLDTLVDNSINAKYFRKGFRVFNDDNYALIGTNTHLSGIQVPEYKPFYFFFIDDGARQMPRIFIPDYYYDSLIYFLEFLRFNIKINNTVNHKILALIFMRSIDELQNLSDERYTHDVEKLVRDIINNHFGFDVFDGMMSAG